MTRVGLHQLAKSAAADGDIATWDDAAGLWVPAPVNTGGVPVGGTTGQVLTKQSGTDYDVDWATPAGGGGGGSTFPLDPATLHGTYGDHFTGTGLDAKWTRVGYVSGDETYQVAATYMQVQTARGAGNYYYQAAPAGDFSIVMGLSVQQQSGVMFGPLILTAAGAGVCAAAYSGSDGYYALGVTSVAYNSSATVVVGNSYSAYSSGGRAWIRLRKSGTSYRTAISFNGQFWQRETAALTSAITPARIGFGSILNAPNQFAVDFFDVQ